jgi:hypothetical protein
MRKGVSLVVLIITIIVVIILSFTIISAIVSNASVLEIAEEAKALSNFVTIQSEVELSVDTTLIKNPEYTSILELLPIEKDESGKLITMNLLDNTSLYSEIRILQGFSEEVDLSKVYKLKLITSNNAYAVINEKNNSFEIILADGVKLGGDIFYSKTILDAIIKVKNTKSLEDYKQIISMVQTDKIITNFSENGGFELGTYDWQFYADTDVYSSVKDDYQMSVSSALNIDCDQPQNKEYSVYKDLVSGK